MKSPFSRGKVVSYVLTKIARFAKNIPNDAAFLYQQNRQHLNIVQMNLTLYSVCTIFQAWCLACLNFLVSTSWLPDKFPQSSHLQSVIALASFVTMKNSVLWTEKLLVHSPMLCATHIFQVLQNWLHLSIVQTSLTLHSICTIFRFPGIEIIFVPNGKGNLWKR